MYQVNQMYHPSKLIQQFNQIKLFNIHRYCNKNLQESTREQQSLQESNKAPNDLNQNHLTLIPIHNRQLTDHATIKKFVIDLVHVVEHPENIEAAAKRQETIRDLFLYHLLVTIRNGKTF